MSRIWHPYTVWEDYLAGMWRITSAKEKEALLPQAIAFTGDDALYGAAMLRVVREWPLACEHNLTDMGINQRAWVGHAACCLAIGCPEDVTRMSWGHLSDEQRDRANARADYAIFVWQTAQSDRKQLGLFGGAE